MHNRELFRWFPEAERSVPWLPLAQLPTPLRQFDIELPGGRAPVWVKRDDVAADPYGGNKVRKLEFLLADAIAKKATRVITAGAFGSHHALATTVYARAVGIDATVVVFPQDMTPHVEKILYMIAGLGADMRFTRRMEFVPVALGRVRRACGKHAYVIPPGGSNALGTLGYVECGLELAAQWRDGVAPQPRRIHVAAGTLGTTAGLALGLAIAGVDVEIAATRITSRLVTNERALASLIHGARQLLLTAVGGSASPQTLPSVAEVMHRVTFVHDQIGAGYGRATEAADDATRRFADAGLTLDTTYTAKAAAALLADPLTQRGETMFLHTLSALEPITATANVSLADLPRQVAAYMTTNTTGV